MISTFTVVENRRVRNSSQITQSARGGGLEMLMFDHGRGFEVLDYVNLY